MESPENRLNNAEDFIQKLKEKPGITAYLAGSPTSINTLEISIKNLNAILSSQLFDPLLGPVIQQNIDEAMRQLQLNKRALEITQNGQIVVAVSFPQGFLQEEDLKLLAADNSGKVRFIEYYRILDEVKSQFIVLF